MPGSSMLIRSLSALKRLTKEQSQKIGELLLLLEELVKKAKSTHLRLEGAVRADRRIGGGAGQVRRV